MIRERSFTWSVSRGSAEAGRIVVVERRLCATASTTWLVFALAKN